MRNDNWGSKARIGIFVVGSEVVPEAEQGIGYGMPALTYRGKSLLSVMRAKKHIGLYPFSPAAIQASTPDLTGFDLSKGTIRFQPGRPIPDAVLIQLVEARQAEIDG